MIPDLERLRRFSFMLPDSICKNLLKKYNKFYIPRDKGNIKQAIMIYSTPRGQWSEKQTCKC